MAKLAQLTETDWRQVYKATMHGLQTVAIKVISFDASDKQRADFEKEVGVLTTPGLTAIPASAAVMPTEVVRSIHAFMPSPGTSGWHRWPYWSRAAIATSCSSWAAAATAGRRCSSQSVLLDLIHH